MYQLVASLYVGTLPFIFALTAAEGRATPTMLVSVVMLFLLVIDGRMRAEDRPAVRSVLLTGLPLLCYVLVGPVLTNSFETRSLTHYLAYATSVVLFFMVPALFLSINSHRISPDRVLKALTAGLLLASGYAVVQFLLRNAFDINIESYLPFPGGIEADSTVLGLYYRARGFAPEPGHFALYLEACTPFMAYYFSRNRQRIGTLARWACFCMVGLAILATASPVPLLVMSLAFGLAAILVRPRLRLAGWASIAAVVGLICVAVLALGRMGQGADSAADLAWELAFGKVGSYSADDRLHRLDTARSIIDASGPYHHLVGSGAAVSEKLGLADDQTIFLLYPLLVAEIGLLGLALFCFAFAGFALKAGSLPDAGRRYWWWGFLTVLMHYSIIANYWYPYLWFFGVVPYLFQEHAKERT